MLSGGSALASGDPQGPSKEPKVEGPLSSDGSQCSNDVVRSDSGTLLGRTEVCLYLYSFDTLSEIDLLREHGAAWLQARFVPEAGWCATSVSSRVALSGGRGEAISKDSAAGRKMDTKLTVTAAGNAPLENGRVSQTWAAAKGTIETSAPDGGQPVVASKWQGKSAKPVNLVSGVAYSYDLLAGAPGKVNFGFTDFALTTC